MPNIVEIKSSQTDKTIKIDLDFLVGRGNHAPRNSSRLVRQFEGQETRGQGDPLLSMTIFQLIDEAYTSTPLAIVDTDRQTFDAFGEKSVLTCHRDEFSFVDPAAAFATIKAVRNTLDQNLPTPQAEMLRLSSAVSNIIRIMTNSGLNISPILPNAEISYVGQKVGDDDFMFIPGIFHSLTSADENPAFFSRAGALAVSEIENPTGLDAIKGPIFGYAAERSDFTVQFSDIEDMFENAVLNKENRLDWDSTWENLTCGRAESIIDRIETRSLQDRLSPILDPIFETMKDVANETADDDLINDAMKHHLSNAKDEIEGVLAAWNAEQSAYDYSEDQSVILTFKDGLSRQQIIDALHDSAQNALEQIATLRSDDLTRPWEAYISQRLEVAYTVMLGASASHEREVNQTKEQNAPAPVAPSPTNTP